MICVIIFTNTTYTYAADAAVAVGGSSITELLEALCSAVLDGSGVTSSASSVIDIYNTFEAGRTDLINSLTAKQVTAKLFDESDYKNVNKNTKCFGGLVVDDDVINYVSDFVDYYASQVDLDAVVFGDFSISNKFFNKYISGINPDFDFLDTANTIALDADSRLLPGFMFKDADGIWNIYYEYYDDYEQWLIIDASGNISIRHSPNRYNSYYYDQYLVTYNPDTDVFSKSSVFGGFYGPISITASDFYWLIPDARVKCKLNLTVSDSNVVYYYTGGVITINAFAGVAGAVAVGKKSVVSSDSIAAVLGAVNAKELTAKNIEELKDLVASKALTDAAVSSDLVFTLDSINSMKKQLSELNELIKQGSSNISSVTDYSEAVTNIYNSYSNSYTADYDDLLDSIAVHSIDILSAILSLPATIAQSIADLFVPSAEAIDDTVQLFKRKLPWIDLLKEFAKDLHSALLNTDDTFEPVIYIELGNTDKNYSTINYGGRAVALDLRWYKAYKAQVDEIISALMWLVFLWELFKKIPGIINGSSMVMTKTVEISQYGINEAGDVR